MNVRQALPRLLLLVVLASVATWAMFNRELLDGAVIEQSIQSAGLWAPLLFVALWVVWALLFLPGALIGLAGGALFGPVWGVVWNLTGATLGATLAFIVARYVASNRVTTMADGRLKKLLDGVDAEGWRFVAFTRLVPLFPFNLLNYALGLTRIRLWHYVITTLICMAPGTIAYTYLGYAGREAVGGGEDLIQKGLLALALLAIVAFLPRLVRRMRQQPVNWLGNWIDVPDLKQQLAEGSAPTIIDVRGADEFNGPLGHIPGSKNIALSDLQDQISTLDDIRDQPIVLVCKTDKRSGAAAHILETAGFSDVRVLSGGVDAWRSTETST
jgi:uncharacterized membrane protein YdjX (TVP38/TMEM64 family)/rhodanese-related sulfurtransferase